MTEQQDRAASENMTESQTRVQPGTGADPGTAPRGRPLRRDVALALVFAGGAAGTAAREALSLAFPTSGGIPYATWAINVVGSLSLGLLLGVLMSGGPAHHRRLRLAAGTGFCGGFTTYSTLAVQTADLAGRGLWGASAAYTLGTLLIGAVAAWVGIAAGSAAVRRRRAPDGVGPAR